MSKRRSAIALLAGALGASGWAAPTLGQERAAGTSPPNFTGVWQKNDFGFLPPYLSPGKGRNAPPVVIDGHNNPILKPWVAERVMQNADASRVRLTPLVDTACWAEGVPTVLGVADWEILQTPTKITVLYHTDSQIRHIYLNQPHSKPVPQSWYGESVGHFEGDTLVVDTVGFLNNKFQAMVDHFGTPVTSDLHVVERYHLIEAGKKMQVDFTVEDPNVFKKPWSLSLTLWLGGCPANVGRACRRKDWPIEENRCSENDRDHLALIPRAEKPDF